MAAAVPGLLTLREAGDYTGVFRALSGLGPAIDVFFETVRVNADQADLKELRHAFLREVYGLFARFADFSEVAPLESVVLIPETMILQPGAPPGAPCNF